MSKRENRNKKLSLIAKNDKEIITILASEILNEMTIIRQSSGRTSRDTYYLESMEISYPNHTTSDGMRENKKSTKLCSSKSCTFNIDGSFSIEN